MVCKSRLMAVTAITIILISTAVNAAPEISQTFNLTPGWNAVFLEVRPENTDPAYVFKDLPVESVWTWLGRNSTVEFIQNPNEGLREQPGWNVFFPPSSPEAFLSDLYAVQANRAYLVKLKGQSDITWTVKGRPSARTARWMPDSFNLIGFRVSLNGPPTFSEYFAPSNAHAGLAIYSLNDNGEWQFVDNTASTAIHSGEAYWVYCDGASSYQGPLTVETGGNGLNFGSVLTEKTITLNNNSDTNISFLMKELPAVNPVSLVYKKYDSAAGKFSWPSISELEPVNIKPGRKAAISLLVRRESFVSNTVDSVLEITDSIGTRILIPVEAKR